MLLHSFLTVVIWLINRVVWWIMIIKNQQNKKKTGHTYLVYNEGETTSSAVFFKDNKIKYLKIKQQGYQLITYKRLWLIKREFKCLTHSLIKHTFHIHS